MNSPTKRPATNKEFVSPEKLELMVGSPFRQKNPRISLNKSPNSLKMMTRSVNREAGTETHESVLKKRKKKQRKTRLSEGTISEPGGGGGNPGGSAERAGLSFKEQRRRHDSARSFEGAFVQREGRQHSMSEPGSGGGAAGFHGSWAGFGGERGFRGKRWGGGFGRGGSGRGDGGCKTHQVGGVDQSHSRNRSKLVNLSSRPGENKENAVESTEMSQETTPQKPRDNLSFSKGGKYSHSISGPGRGGGDGGSSGGGHSRCSRGVSGRGIRGAYRGQGRGLTYGRGRGFHRGGRIWGSHSCGEISRDSNRGRGLGQFRGRTAVRKRESTIRSFVQGEFKEYMEYPGWSADEIHWLLEEAKHFHHQNCNIHWLWVSSIMKSHSPAECENLLMKIIGNLKPLALETALDYVKTLLCQSVSKNKGKEIECLRKQQTFNEFLAEKENLTKKPLQDLLSKLQTMNNLQRANYFALYSQSVKDCSRACIYYFKEHPEEFQKLSNLQEWYEKSFQKSTV